MLIPKCADILPDELIEKIKKGLSCGFDMPYSMRGQFFLFRIQLEYIPQEQSYMCTAFNYVYLTRHFSCKDWMVPVKIEGFELMDQRLTPLGMKDVVWEAIQFVCQVLALHLIELPEYNATEVELT